MKASIAILLFLIAVLTLHAGNEAGTIIPRPLHYSALEGHFTINHRTRYFSETPLAADGLDYFQARLHHSAGYQLGESGQLSGNTIRFRYDAALGDEAYTLRVDPQKILIEAGSRAGFFYAAVSLLQLMDPAIWSIETPKRFKSDWQVTACAIEDRPRFQWRGVMLDSARNFFPVAYVKKFIDRMAQYKLNRFHWHLSDDEGWRVEITAYPLLTRIGAERGPGTALPFSLYPAMRGPKEKVQRGYYTQQEIREIVAYAEKRNVAILPEIDMPGHAKAAVMSYPNLLQDTNDTSRYRSVQKVANNTVDPGLESSYIFMETVIKELSTLFPFEYIHLGGDEIPRGAWEHSPAVAELKKREHLESNTDVQAYFFTRMDAILARYGRKLIAWQEVREHRSRLRDDTVIMAWRGDGRGYKAAKSGYKVIMAPAAHLYFDQQYRKNNNEPGHTWAGPTDTREVYDYQPTAGLQGSKAIDNVIGVHACLWSERLFNEELADYMAWPRTLALSEIAWSPAGTHDWVAFEKRMVIYGLPRLQSQQIRYRRPAF